MQRDFSTLRINRDFITVRHQCQWPADRRFGLYPGADWDVWVHKYDLLGLLTYYHYTGGDQKFYGSTPSQAGVIGVRSERHHLICPPYAKRHGGEDFLELVQVVGGEQSERAPFSWPQGRTPKAKQVSLRSELA